MVGIIIESDTVDNAKVSIINFITKYPDADITKTKFEVYLPESQTMYMYRVYSDGNGAMSVIPQTGWSNRGITLDMTDFNERTRGLKEEKISLSKIYFTEKGARVFKRPDAVPTLRS